jgi:Ca-activated chloride channel family protein
LTQKPKIILQPFVDAPQCYQFASAVIMFGAMLRKSRFLKEVSWNSILQTATNAVDANSYSQKEFLSIVQLAKNIYSKKRKKEKDE